MRFKQSSSSINGHHVLPAERCRLFIKRRLRKLISNRQNQFFFFLVTVVLVSTASAHEQDVAFRQQLATQGVTLLDPVSPTDSNLHELGKSLFFDRELSGNRDTSCASCHHPSLGSGDSRPLPSGVGGEGLGPNRTRDKNRQVVPRNAPELFQRSDSRWTSMFWDSRISKLDGHLTSPAGANLPAGMDDILSVQAMFPVTSRAEMRGKAGDLDVHGNVNEVGLLADNDLPGIWESLINRLLEIPEYKQAFKTAFPTIPTDQLGFEHAAIAIATYEEQSFTANDTAWDRYLSGEDNAITDSAKRGARFFHGGNCSSCHSGSLMTDQKHHNMGVPQLGPGKDPISELDPGRFLETGESEDTFAFRTPPLRNVVLTGPWMHNGGFSSLEDVIRQKFDPDEYLANYDTSQLPEGLRGTVQLDDDVIASISKHLSSLLPSDQVLTDDNLQDLLAYLFSLTSPSIDELVHSTPKSVPSGLEVDRIASGDLQITYDPKDGQLILQGPEDLTVDALFLRISENEEGLVAGFEFNRDGAEWSEDLDIVLSNKTDSQSFIDYRTEPLFLLGAGDSLDSLLPAGLSKSAIDHHFTAAYRIHGLPILWPAEVTLVPEPSSITMLVIAFGIVTMRRRVAPLKTRK